MSENQTRHLGLKREYASEKSSPCVLIKTYPRLSPDVATLEQCGSERLELQKVGCCGFSSCFIWLPIKICPRINLLSYDWKYEHLPIWLLQSVSSGPQVASSKQSACQCRRRRSQGSIPGTGKCPEGGNGNQFQYSCLENPMKRGVWWATVHGVTQSQTWLSRHTPYIIRRRNCAQICETLLPQAQE